MPRGILSGDINGDIGIGALKTEATGNVTDIHVNALQEKAK